MFSKEIVYLDDTFQNQEQLFEAIAKDLYEKGYVEVTYLKAISDREKTYPTGINTLVTGIAIPHTDSIHIKKQGIAFVRLAKPVMFKEMVTNNPVQVHLLFFLLVKEKHQQVEVLSKLMALFSNEDFINKLLSENKKENLLKALTEI
ncbi:PTS sugar transporter subunit IIA [Fervidibacillus albus]|uniref:PTS sugar transporter subunit IIA n=1 Tax=Fervidibacillus albus TaxID=2980026 RepID=A0A9E8LTK2_9BACI|nr:PTS sugar transporter subunit IIA [Fervidibacillus albus]WAA09364.1 PTS sugar transporter subunit IIA [Fervidibacillus albus]